MLLPERPLLLIAFELAESPPLLLRLISASPSPPLLQRVAEASAATSAPAALLDATVIRGLGFLTLLRRCAESPLLLRSLESATVETVLELLLEDPVEPDLLASESDSESASESELELELAFDCVSDSVVDDAEDSVSDSAESESIRPLRRRWFLLALPPARPARTMTGPLSLLSLPLLPML